MTVTEIRGNRTLAITTGTRLGVYEVVAPIGAGGMGEVYRARDTKLNREVALKVLPPAFSSDPQYMARLEREAQILASLNHPNIAAIYGLEGEALVMELVEGETLAGRIAQGPVALDEALQIARQIAEGLETAHEKGIIHRDLKPENIKITPAGTVKILDFGLAKAAEEPSAISGNRAMSPTLSLAMTQAGMILGTAAYMSPEQAKGKTVDKRADIWAFGVVLYEMLTGRCPFAAEDVSETLAAVLTRNVGLTAPSAEIPAGLQALLRACLTRDPRNRLRDIGDARIALDRVLTDAPQELAPSRAPVSRARIALPWAIAALALVGCAATAVVLATRAPGGSTNMRTSLALPDGLGIPTLSYYGGASLATLTVSPAGDQVAFVGFQNGEGALYLRRFDSFDAVRLTKSEGAMAPFFSPDGRQLAFFARGRLWRIDLPGGVPVDLAPAAKSSLGGCWGEDGQIVYTPSYSDALWTIPATGGKARMLTKIDGAAGQISHRWPCVLPGGAGVLFAIKLATNETLDDARIAIADLKTGEHRVLLDGGSMPRYLDDGRLVFARAGKLYAVALDLSARSIRGAPVPVLDGVATSPVTGAAWYDVTRQGLLAYAAGGKVRPVGRFSWEGPGHPAEVLERLDAFGNHIRLSRDSKRAIVQIAAANDKLWLIDLEQMNATRLTSGGGNDNAGVLSPDGRWLLFASDRAGGGHRFYRMPLNGSAPPESLLEGKGRIHSISYPARMPGFTMDSARDGTDAYVMAVAEDGTPAGKPILVAGGPNDQACPTVSADGTLVAYQSSESGRDEIYVARLSDPGNRRRVTNDGGTIPLWSRDGRRLFYLSNDRVVSVELRSAPDLRFDAPQAVTRSDVAGKIESFDVAPDGTSALVGRVADPLMLRRDIRIWPGWGKALPSVE